MGNCEFFDESALRYAARLCPRCGGWCGVSRGRERKDGAFIRRRFCPVCEVEFDTMEIATGYVKKRKKSKKGQI